MFQTPSIQQQPKDGKEQGKEQLGGYEVQHIFNLAAGRNIRRTKKGLGIILPMAALELALML